LVDTLYNLGNLYHTMTLEGRRGPSRFFSEQPP
jgi:hypothetical protein